MRLLTTLAVSASLATLPGLVRAASTGCDMTPGSPLMNCPGTWASMPPIPSATGTTNGQSAKDLCDQYTQMANCWAEGMYCREWLPVQTAADKFCGLAAAAESPSSSSIPSETFSSVSAEASEVVTSIWNNDSDMKVPSITNDINTVARPTWTHAGSDASTPTQTGTAATAGAASASGSVGTQKQGGGASGAAGVGAAGGFFLGVAGAAMMMLA